MSDRISLRGLRIFGNHGVFEHERVDGQTFVVDLDLGFDLSAAASTDALADTIDYGAVAETAVRVVGADPCNLIETVAVRLADAVLAHHRVDSVTVSIHKPDAPIPHSFDDVVVTVTRRR